MFDDDAARRVLQALADDSEPPVTTTFDQVLRQGRRRVFMQRAGAVAGVVGVVAAIGVGALLLRPGEPSGNSVRVADHPSTTSSLSTNHETETTRTTERPATPSAMVPGWQVAEPKGFVDCATAVIPPVEADVALRSEQTVKQALAGVVRQVLGKPPVVVSSVWEAESQKHPGPRGYVTVTVPMDNGNGDLNLEATRFGGPPLRMADLDIFAYGDCELPQRRVLPDGTVMQLYGVKDEKPEQPIQIVRIYRPDGLAYYITSAGFSEEDMVRVGDSETVVGGRGKLPANPGQLAAIAEKFVTILE